MPQPSKISYIQGMRAAAVMVVMIYHYTYGAPLVRYGFLGVDLFFVVSGLIMVHATAGRFGQASAAEFIGRRFCRIWPTYAVLSLIALFTGGAPTSAEVEHFFASIALVPMWGSQPTIQPGWSLVFEAFFYLAIAVSMLAGRLKWVALFALLAFCMFALPPLLGVPVSMWSGPALPKGYDYAALVSQPIIWCFVAGAAVGLIARTGLSISPAIAFGGLAVIVAIAFVMFRDAQPSHGLVVALLLGGAVLLLALLNNRRAIAVPKIIVWIGDISYSIYLVHLPLQHLLVAHGWWTGGDRFYYLSTIPYVALVLICAALSRRYLELRLSDAIRDVAVKSAGRWRQARLIATVGDAAQIAHDRAGGDRIA